MSLPNSNIPVLAPVPKDGESMDLTAAESGAKSSDSQNAATNDRKRFVVTMASICLMIFVSSLGSSIATALPTISNNLKAEGNYVWIASSFLLAQTVVQPPCAQLCNIFGRKAPMISAMVIFAVGSAISGSSKSAAILILGRTIQGCASGCITMLAELIVCDLVPLRDRGRYVGFVLSAAAVATIVGPIISGALAEKNWRWIFYLNIPVCGITVLLMAACLRLRHNREAPITKALRRIDWIGSVLFIGSMSSILVGVTLGGSVYPWSSWRVILPLVIGALGWIGYHVFESTRLCIEPSTPSHLFRNRTSVSGFYMTFLSSILIQWAGFFWPIYFQYRGDATLESGVNMLPFLFSLMPVASVSGIILSKFGRYRPLHAIGFILIILGLGLNISLNTTTRTAVWAVFQVINAAGQGLVLPTLLPAILTSLSESDVASATGLYSFCRSFGYVWGTTIPSIIFNNQFEKESWKISDADIRRRLGSGRAYQSVSGAYIKSLEPGLREQLLSAYTLSLRAVWIGAVAFGVAGTLGVFVERHISLRESLDTKYGLENGRTDCSYERSQGKAKTDDDCEK